MSGSYHTSRFVADGRRETLWRALWQYHFRHMISPDDCVLDLGAGYGSFINNVTARRRIALDAWPGFAAHLSPGVEAIVGDATALDGIDDGTVDFAFASNLFEHLSQDAFRCVLSALKLKLSERGILVILQPNYRYAFREYFDDYTHLSIYSHVSIVDFLDAHNWDVIDLRPRFLPLTIKSRIPVHRLLIRAYLASPLKLGGKQMLIHAKPRR